MAASKKTPDPKEPAGAPPVPAHLAAKLDRPTHQTNDDPVVNEAVDVITTKEADEVLAAEDNELAKAFEPNQEPAGFKAKVKAFFKAWWQNPKARYGTLAGLAVIAVVVAVVPQSRYFVLNNVGVRASASVVVIDQSTQQPLKNVEVEVAHQTAKTDSEGKAVVKHIKLGPTEVVIKKRAFSEVSKKVVVGWGSNPYGSFTLNPTGSQYDFVITDFMSSKPITKAEVSAGEATAIADEQGNAVLTVDPGENSPLDVTIKAVGYRDEIVSLNLDDKNPSKVSMVPSRKHGFVSKRSGKYDLYSIDVDGKNEKLLLAGTGTERDDIALAPNATENIVAIASTRDNNRNREGFLLTTLNLVNTDSGEKTTITQSEDIKIVDWIGKRIVFVQTVAGASANNPNRMRLISYNIENNTQKELASSNHFSDVLSAGGNVYYAPSEASSGQTGFFRTNPEGTNRTNLLSKTTYNIFRTKYDHLTVSAMNEEWYDFKLGENTVSKLSGPPANYQNRAYHDDSERKNSIWTETRDGKGVLLRYDTNTQEDEVLRSQSGLDNPMYWLNDSYVIYRIHTDQESADYVLNLGGGQPRKIGDVTNTTGLGNWYYY